VDLDGNGAYNDSVDSTENVVPLDNFEGKYYSNSTIGTDTVLHYVKTNTSDGLMTVHVYVAEEFTLVNNSLITPFETKIDIEINNYVYQNASSRLALYTKLESSAQYEDENETHDEQEGHSSDEEGVKTTMNNTVGFFTWKKTATIDGVPRNVTRSLKESDAGQEKIYLNYPNGTQIYHDPKLGVAISTQPTSSGIPFINSYILIALISLITVVYVLSKKQKYF
ncbi:MAG: hypothetical protein ACXACR_17760, partial [Candidatus Hodarchaeales archaeon]